MADTKRKLSLSEIRLKAGKSQKEVADELGISVNTYRRWEKNIGLVDASKAVALAHYFKVRLGAFLL